VLGHGGRMGPSTKTLRLERGVLREEGRSVGHHAFQERGGAEAKVAPLFWGKERSGSRSYSRRGARLARGAGASERSAQGSAGRARTSKGPRPTAIPGASGEPPAPAARRQGRIGRWWCEPILALARRPTCRFPPSLRIIAARRLASTEGTWPSTARARRRRGVPPANGLLRCSCAPRLRSEAFGIDTWTAPCLTPKEVREMLVIPGDQGVATCDGLTRRELLRVGGSSLFGLSLAQLLAMRSSVASEAAGGGGPGWGKAKSVILIYLQGGPSHLDLWDPKENCPDDVQSIFPSIPTKVPGVHVTELLPRLAQVTDKLTFIRSMSYSPNGLFNHTAAIYQMLTGYTADAVSPSGQLEPPTPK